MSEEKPKPHPLQRAWAAGVFDAKCYWPKAGYQIRFESMDEPMMKRFAETIPYGNLLENPDKPKTLKTIWIWQTSSMDDTRETLLLLVPFLSAIRMKQASEMIAKIERNPTWQKKNPEKAQEALTLTKEKTPDL